MKIIIEPTRCADTRSADKIVDKETLLRESHLHRSHVRRVMAALAAEMVERGERHDFTKVDPAGIDAFHDAFVLTQRREARFIDQAWWKRHLSEERHHINDRLHHDADLLDLLEMIVDCVCAGKARSGKVYPINVEPTTLLFLFGNTVGKLINRVQVEGEE